MTLLNLLEKSLENKKQTQLGVGPMSKNCVDATIELANEIRHPLMLIASRRQIECKEQGSGYVNNWSTEEFANYVKERDKNGYVVLCRDHGGPWQNYLEVENQMSLEQAMESAKKSFAVDIKSGFDIIHIDPSIDIHKELDKKEVLERLFKLYDWCIEQAKKFGKNIRIEIGTEEQSGKGQNLIEFKDTLRKVENFCNKQNFQKPLFVVAQTGTLIKEASNVGNFKKINLPGLIKVLKEFGFYLKEHNADYLSDSVLSQHPILGISSANIAPEFGVGETRYILKICEEFGLKKEEDEFLELAFNSQKWQKWMKKDTIASDREKAIIAGHYVFTKPEFKHIMERIKKTCLKRGFDLDKSLKQELKSTIFRIIKPFNLIK